MTNEATAKAKSGISSILKKRLSVLFSHMYIQKAELNHAIEEKSWAIETKD